MAETLVQKGDYLARRNEDNTATLFKVLLADDELFCVGEVIFDPAIGEPITSYVDTQIYTNDVKVGILSEYGFEKVEVEESEE